MSDSFAYRMLMVTCIEGYLWLRMLFLEVGLSIDQVLSH